MLNKIKVFIFILLISFTFSGCFTGCDIQPPVMTPKTLTWKQTDPQPEYWEIEMSTVRCGQEDLVKRFECHVIPYTYIPDEVFPGYNTLITKVRAVIGEQRSDWSNIVILKR